MSFNIENLSDYFLLVNHTDWLAIVCYGFVGHYDCPRCAIHMVPHCILHHGYFVLMQRGCLLAFKLDVLYSDIAPNTLNC
jgi:hypothetical protein